jgi:hypothetical protein
MLLALFYFQTGCNSSLKSNVMDSASQSTTSSSAGGNASTGGNTSAGNPVKNPVNGGNSGSSSGKTNQDCQISTISSGVITVLHGRSQVFFESSQVVSPAVCKSQVRTCNNGFLSGTYNFLSCSVKQSDSLGAGSSSGTGTSTNSGSGSTVSSTTSTSTTSTTIPTNPLISNLYTTPILLSHLQNQNEVADSGFSYLPSIEADGKFVAFFGNSPTQTMDRYGIYSGGVIENLQTGQRRRVANMVSGERGLSAPCTEINSYNLNIQMTAGAAKILFNDCLTSFNSLGGEGANKLGLGFNVLLNYNGLKLASYDSLNKNIYLHQMTSSSLTLTSGQILNARAAGEGLAIGTNWLAYCDDQKISGSDESTEINLVNLNTFEILKLGRGYCRGMQIAGNDSQFYFVRSSSALLSGEEKVLYDISSKKITVLNLPGTYSYLTADGKTICVGEVHTDGKRRTEIKIYSVVSKSLSSTVFSVDIYKSLKCSNNADIIVFDTRDKFSGYTYPEGGNDLQVYMIKRK